MRDLIPIPRGVVLNSMAQLQALPFWGIALYIAHTQAVLLFALSLLCLGVSLAHYKRYRLIVDTPTTRLSTGAQGYVELAGTARLPTTESFRGPAHLPPTLWMPGVCTKEPFILDDDNGECLLYPAKAEVFAIPSLQTHHPHSAIFAGQTIYVLGELRTIAGVNRSDSIKIRASEMIAQWKRHPTVLLEGYDHDGNGELDPEEWEQVRQHALSIAQKDLDDEILNTSTHVIEQAQSGRLFIITNLLPEQLAQRYQISSYGYALAWLLLMLLAWLGR